MTQERQFLDRVWEATKDISVKVSQQVGKHWKINTLKVDIAAFRQRKNTKFKELGKFVYSNLCGELQDEEEYKNTVQSFFNEIKELDSEIESREARIKLIEEEFKQAAESDEETVDFSSTLDETGLKVDDLPPLPDDEDDQEESAESEKDADSKAESESATESDEPTNEKPEASEKKPKRTTRRKKTEDKSEEKPEA